MTEGTSGSRSEGFGVARNSAFLAAGNLGALAIGFGTTLLVTDQLGAERYGLLVGAQRFVAFFAVVAYFGMHPLLVRASATRSEEVGALLGTVLLLRAGLGVLFGLLVALVAMTTGYLPNHRLLLFAVAFTQIPLAFAEAFTAVCEGRERMGRVAWVTLIRTLTILLCVGTAVVLHGGLGSFVAAYLVGGFAELAATLLLTRGVIPDLRLQVRLARLLPLFREAVPFVVIGLGYMALRGLDVMILTRFSTIPEVSRYGAALNFSELLAMLALLVQRALLPAFSRLKFTNTANDLASNSLALFSAVLIPACTGLALLADSVVRLYPSREYDAAAPVLRVLSGAIVFLGPSIVCATFLTGAGRLRVIMEAYAVAVPVQGAVSLLLVSDHAAVGVATGTLFGQATLSAFLLRASTGLGMRIAYPVILRQVVSAALMALVVAATRSLPIAVPVVVGSLTYAGALWVIAPLESPERRVLADLASRWRRR